MPGQANWENGLRYPAKSREVDRRNPKYPSTENKIKIRIIWGEMKIWYDLYSQLRRLQWILKRQQPHSSISVLTLVNLSLLWTEVHRPESKMSIPSTCTRKATWCYCKRPVFYLPMSKVPTSSGKTRFSIQNLFWNNNKKITRFFRQSVFHSINKIVVISYRVNQATQKEIWYEYGETVPSHPVFLFL